MMIEQLLQKIRLHPDTVCFDEVLATIGEHYQYTPTRFRNGLGDDCVINEAGQNEGSCRIFAFAQMNGLNQAETLCCFGRFYRDDVLGNPDGSDHANIRHFMRDGWSGIAFDSNALVLAGS